MLITTEMLADHLKYLIDTQGNSLAENLGNDQELFKRFMSTLLIYLSTSECKAKLKEHFESLSLRELDDLLSVLNSRVKLVKDGEKVKIFKVSDGDISEYFLEKEDAYARLAEILKDYSDIGSSSFDATLDPILVPASDVSDYTSGIWI